MTDQANDEYDAWSDSLIAKMDMEGATLQTGPCVRCVHKHPGANACDAYPVEGIPLAIASGNNLHTTPVKGDHGIQFKAKVSV